MKLDHSNSEDISEGIASCPIALLPIGAVEAHGAHLPLGTDNFLAEKLCERITQKIPAWIFPAVNYGQTWSLQNFPGSFHIPPEVLENYLFAIICSSVKNGFKMFVFINAHLGNGDVIKQVQRRSLEAFPNFRVLNIFYPGASSLAAKEIESFNAKVPFFHADELETSYMMHLCPEYVRIDRAINQDVTYPNDISFRPITWDKFTKTPVMGHALKATASKGEAILEPVINTMVEIIQRNYQDITGK